jgi:hypothetical protein
MRLRCIKQWQKRQTPDVKSDQTTSDPHLHHHIGKSEKVFEEFGQYLRSHARDLAMKVFMFVITCSPFLLVT